MNHEIAKIFLSSVIQRFRESKVLAEKTFIQMKSEEFHFTPNEASNSMAIIIQHLYGNMKSRWTNFLTEDGEKEGRNRDDEFIHHITSRESLMVMWEEGWKIFLDTLGSLTEEDLFKIITIRSKPLVVMDAINRQLAHYSYHVGQIVYLGRWVRNQEWQTLSIPKGGSGIFNQNQTSGT